MSAPQSIEILQSYLEPLGYKFETLNLGYNQTQFTTITSAEGNAMTFSSENPLYPFATSSSRLISRSKLNAYDFVTRVGINVPKTLVIDYMNRQQVNIKQFLDEVSTAIVKPFDGSASSGLTLDVTDLDILDNAIERALTVSKVALVQEQFFGEELRFIVIDGVVRAVILREKPHVIGDGVRTVAELIEVENTQRRNITGSMLVYPQLGVPLINQAIMTSVQILAPGQCLELNKSTMIRGGASIYNVISSIHPSYIELATRATHDIGNGFVVADMMIRDYKMPADTSNYVFIEFNLNPALVLFYSCRDGQSFNIVEDYLGPMLEKVIGRH